MEYNKLIAELHTGDDVEGFYVLKDAFLKTTAAGKPFCVCGEMGGEPAFVLALLGMGFRRLSMSPSRVAAVKRLIASVDRAEAETIAEKALEMETADEVEAYLRAELSRLCGAE